MLHEENIDMHIDEKTMKRKRSNSDYDKDKNTGMSTAHNIDLEQLEEYQNQNLSKKSRVEKSDWAEKENTDSESKSCNRKNTEKKNETYEVTALTDLVKSLLKELTS